MKMRNISAVLATLAMALLCAGPAFADNITKKCGNNVCIQVTNAYQGSDWVDHACVYNQSDPGEPGYFALLVRGTVRYSGYSSSIIGYCHDFGYDVNSGSCVSGRMDGVGTSPCWVAP